MATDLAVIGLTYGGQDIQDLDGIYLEIVRGLGEGPTYRGVDTVVPGRAGQTRRNRKPNVLDIELRGWVRGSGSGETAQRADYAVNRQALLTLFDPELGDQDLVATLEDGTTATIAAMRKSPVVYNQELPSMANVSVALDSVSPTWAFEPAGS